MSMLTFARYWMFIVIAVVFSSSLNAQTVEVPLNHWAYELLDRLRTRGLIDIGLLNTRPISRTVFIKALLSAQKEHNDLLDSAEREAIDFLFFEFSEEVERLGSNNGVDHSHQRIHQQKWLGWLPGPIYSNDRNFLSLNESDFKFYFDPIFYRDGMFNDADTLSRQDRVLQNISGFTFWGTLGKRIGFYLNSRDTKEHGTRTYPIASRIAWPRFGFARGHGTHVFHDETVAYLYLTLPHVDLEIGKNFNRWGPGRTGALALNDYATSYDQIKLTTQLWRAKFTYVHGFLRQHPPVVTNSYESNGVERETFARKYLAAHRLEIAPTAWLNFAVHETVIYGERGLELAYLNPIMFYRSAEHFLGDRDNATMGADIEIRPIQNVRFYGELFIDDFSVARVGENWYGNKTAWLIGCHLTDPLNLPRSDLRFELAHLDPYVYTHTFPINVYQNYNTGLGHWAGPNAEVMYAEWLFWASRRWQIQFSAERYLHGANPDERNVGGDLDRAFHIRDNQTAYFLDGIRENRVTFRIESRYEFIRNLSVKLALQATSFENAPGSLGPKDVSTFSLFLSLGINADE